MSAGILGALALLGLCVGPAWAETLGELLKARGVPPVRGLQKCGVLDDGRNLPVERFPGGFLARAHINPSAECTVVLGPDLAVRGVLAGWPVATLADGRIVYQRNQIHFASFHPVALALFDPRRGTDLTLYPRKPYRAARAAHVARMRSVYSPAWCSVHNHPCDPELFDERVNGEVVTDARGDALAFLVVWDNTAGGKRLGQAVAGPEEVTEVVYVYTGLRRPDTMKYRELLRRDFEARFGPGAPRRALEADVLRQIFRSDPD